MLVGIWTSATCSRAIRDEITGPSQVSIPEKIPICKRISGRSTGYFRLANPSANPLKIGYYLRSTVFRIVSISITSPPTSIPRYKMLAVTVALCLVLLPAVLAVPLASTLGISFDTADDGMPLLTLPYATYKAAFHDTSDDVSLNSHLKF